MYKHNTVIAPTDRNRMLLIASQGASLRALVEASSREAVAKAFMESSVELLDIYIKAADRFEGLIREGETLGHALNKMLDERLLEKHDLIVNPLGAIITYLSRPFAGGVH